MATTAAAGERCDAEPAAVELLRRHGGRLMAVARRYSSCREDAEDAYQRAVEILLVRPPRIEQAQLLPWMKTVVKHEAFAVARQRARHGTPSEAAELEPHAGRSEASHEVAERRERLRLGAEALGRLKPQETRALLLRADGLSYREICAVTGWTYTKVNRCLSEGRASFVDRVAGIERGAECERLAPLVSLAADGELSAEGVEALRPHLGGCLACRARLREYRRAPARAAAAVAPVGVLSMLRSLAHGTVGHLPAAAAQKAAVVAATVAVAGGGAVALHERAAPAPARGGPHVHRTQAPPGAVPAPPRSPLRPAPPGPRGVTRSGGQLRGHSRRAGDPGRAGRDKAARHGARRAAPATGEFTPTPAPTRAPPRRGTPRPAPRHPTPDPPGGEFAP